MEMIGLDGGSRLDRLDLLCQPQTPNHKHPTPNKKYKSTITNHESRVAAKPQSSFNQTICLNLWDAKKSQHISKFTPTYISGIES
jgi:hypothetical protein